MKLQIASDLHLEFPENRQWLEAMPIIPSGEILLLAGDITTARTKHIEWVGKFFRKLEKEFSFIISVPGNHEFYHGEVNFAYPSYEQRLAKNHTLLNNRAIVIDNVRFLVSTLWSNIPPQYEESIELCINDYSYIKNNSVEKTNELHRLSVAFLKAELARPFNGQTVVLTHYLPSYKCVSEKFNDSVLNSA
ncbi:MAG: metallophosphoesterase, partial [DPANN group archaeon]|nr:metallophosphoesterase [DPANN group archaeon]